MVLLELFSGIGGFSLGLEQAGFKFQRVYFSEIDKHAVANFKFNFPNAENIGSVTNITRADITRPNVIVFGSPCQDFSVAGHGAGLGGERSSLIGHAVEAVRLYRPDIFVWENVKGVLFRKHSADFWAITKAFADIGGYRLEWQLLNTSWFLPQNRERVYLVGRRSDICSGDVFPIEETSEIYSEIQKSEIPSCTGTIMKSCASRSFMDPYVQVIPPQGEYIMNLTDVDFERIRMLTEIECERLQGFPDDFTRWGNYDGGVREIGRPARYGLLGNAVSVPVVRQVGSNILHNTIIDM